MTFNGIYKSFWAFDGQLLIEVKGNKVQVSDYSKSQTEHGCFHKTKYTKKKGVEILK